MLRRRPWMALLLMLAIARPNTAGPDRPLPIPTLWVMYEPWYDRLLYSAPAHVRRNMPIPPSVILGVYTPRPGVVAYTSDLWTSIRRLEAIMGRYGENYRDMTSGIYDIEAWHATPLAERRDPAAAFARFASIARDQGWTVGITPNPDLTTVPGARCGLNPGESQYDAFLRCDLTGQAARSADVVEVQAQGLETQPEDYRAFVLAAATQARDTNPDVKVIAGLTTGLHATAAQMYEAWNAVRDVVDGYYLSISGDGRLPTALAFVRLLPT